MNPQSIQPTWRAALGIVTLLAVTATGLVLSTGVVNAGDSVSPEKVTHQADIGVHAASIARREFVYETIGSSMCALGFRNDEYFDWFGGPAAITHQCESNVNPICSSGYLPLGVLDAQVNTMNYRCTKFKGGPAPAHPACEARFTAGDASGDSEYTCTAQVQRKCFQSHWQPTGLSTEGYRVTYQCWGRSL